jgi:hypothetical protein
VGLKDDAEMKLMKDGSVLQWMEQRRRAQSRSFMMEDAVNAAAANPAGLFP